MEDLAASSIFHTLFPSYRYPASFLWKHLDALHDEVA
jgi:hypothetical protein